MVCVHGIGQQVRGENSLRTAWWPPLSDGLIRAGKAGLVAEADVGMGFYGDLFRPAGQMLAVGDPPYTPSDVEDGFEQELLFAWWRAAAEADPSVAPPTARDTLVSTPSSVQAALRALSGSKFFAGLALRALISDLKQVRRYLVDDGLREQVRGRVVNAIGSETRVVVAHSLGSVVAYEALCAMPGHTVRALVTIGSPLGIRHLVFDRLRPAPTRSEQNLLGAWPGNGSLAWTNLADAGDVVALVKDLRPLFGQRLRSGVVHNGATAHDATAYLTDELCGQAVAEGLT
ncbi:hypothetical protein AB0442_29515 [Kitasatospora sp. NPDC085895]|uniref:hypothetical protein n=1 Tax=Kitasatospora sp. NPDC085895 TaxID=3155057 RepID=UPI00344EBFB9